MKKGAALGLVAAVAVMLVLGGVWALLGGGRLVRRSVAPARPTPVAPDDIEMRLSKVTIHGVDGGKVVWTVEAASFDTAKDRPVLRITGLRHALVTNPGQPTLTLTAEVMEQNTVSGNIDLQGNVTMTGPELSLRAPSVTWQALAETLRFPQALSVKIGEYSFSAPAQASYNARTGTLRCTGLVELTARGHTLRAQGLEVATADQRLTVFGPAVAEFDVADLDAWEQGRALPPIPTVPVEIARRYQEAMRKR